MKVGKQSFHSNKSEEKKELKKDTAWFDRATSSRSIAGGRGASACC